MNTKVLAILETAYRATLEEQDDTVVWFLHAVRGAGAQPTLLLRGNAVNYAVAAQDAAGLAFGAKQQTKPPRLAEDLSALARKGVPLLLQEEDLSRLGIAREELIAPVEIVPRKSVAALICRHDQVWCF